LMLKDPDRGETMGSVRNTTLKMFGKTLSLRPQ
jgi:hypothetical protein